MNTRRKTARRVGEEITNAGETPQDNQVPPQVQTVGNNQVLVDPLAMMDHEVTESLFQMAQALTTQSQAIITQTKISCTSRESTH